jgi:hypothetical protein
MTTSKLLVAGMPKNYAWCEGSVNDGKKHRSNEIDREEDLGSKICCDFNSAPVIRSNAVDGLKHVRISHFHSTLLPPHNEQDGGNIFHHVLMLFLC